METGIEEKKRRNWRSLLILGALLFFMMGALPMVLSSQILLRSMQPYQITYRTRQVQSQLQVLTSELSKSDYLSGSKDPILDAELNQVSILYDGRIMAVNRDFRIVKDTNSLDEGKINISEDVIRAFQGTAGTSYSKEDGFIGVTLPVTRESDGMVIGALVAEVSTQAQTSFFNRMHDNHRTLMATVLVCLAPLAFLGALAMVSPFGRVRNQMDRVSTGALKQIDPVTIFRETEALTDSYNTLVSRLQRIDDSRQEFVSNVSHELKTPITSMKVLADSLLEQGDSVPVELYREFMGDIREEIERESQIIEDLLTLVRMDKANQELTVKKVDINQFLESLMKRLKPLARQKNLELILESFRPVTGEIDEVKLSLAISNMIENAIKYNRKDGFVRVTLNADYKYFYIKIVDSGIGIPEKDQEHVFERFYRADKARSRDAGSVGGTGLGLSITQEIVQMHHGAIRLHSVEGEGTTFIVRIPLIYIP